MLSQGKSEGIMKTTILALLATAGCAAATGVDSPIAPKAAAPAGCVPALSSNFEITILDAKSRQKRDLALQKRSACSTDGILVAALSDGVIKDSKNRTGYIASNRQFQFDQPPQAGAIYTAGFSACQNSSLALGGSTVWWECKSGNFFNLYDSNELDAAQCSPVEIAIIPCENAADAAGQAGQMPDGQIIGSQVIQTTVVVPLADGQPQVVNTSMTIPICQITDGQLQVHTAPCTQTAVAASTTSRAVAVSQYSDGSIQVTPPGPAGSIPVSKTSIDTTYVATSVPGGNSSLTTAAPTGPASAPQTTSAPLNSGTSGLVVSSLAAVVVGLFAVALL